MASIATSGSDGRGRSRDTCNKNMASPLSPLSKTQSDECTKFHQLRETLTRLRELINSAYHSDEKGLPRRKPSVDPIKEEIQKVAETLDHQFELVCSQMTKNNSVVVQGQKSLQDSMNNMEVLVRQLSGGDLCRAQYEQQISDLKYALQEERMSNNLLQRDVSFKENEVTDLKKRLQDARETLTEIRKQSENEKETMKQMRDSFADLTHEVRQMKENPLGACSGFGPRYGQRSMSCQELDTEDDELHTSFEGSCLTLNDPLDET